MCPDGMPFSLPVSSLNIPHLLAPSGLGLGIIFFKRFVVNATKKVIRRKNTEANREYLPGTIIFHEKYKTGARTERDIASANKSILLTQATLLKRVPSEHRSHHPLSLFSLAPQTLILTEPVSQQIPVTPFPSVS